MDSTTKVVWNPYIKGYFENPYDHLRECRISSPVQQIESLKDSWILLRYKDINEVISSKDHKVSGLSEFFQSKEPYIFRGSDMCPYLSTGTKMWTMYLNGKSHKQARTIMGKSLQLSSLEMALEEAVKVVNLKYSKYQNFNLVDYCGEFIFLVVKEILGLKEKAQLEEIKQYSNYLARVQDLYVPKQVYREINEWLLWGKDIFTDSEFRKQLTLYSQELNLNYSEDEVYSTAALVLMAAFETSKDNLSVALSEIIRNEYLKEYSIEANKSQLNVLIEELFRYSSPLQYTIRVNEYPIEIDSHFIPAKSRLYLALASANRDETIFENPDNIVADRSPNDHMAFGKGLHFCLGATIARQELRVCLKSMVDFLKDYKIDVKEIEWSKQIFMRTVKSCTVVKK